MALSGIGIHYAGLIDHAEDNRLLRDENAQLRSQLRLVQEKVAHIDETLDRVGRFDQKLRALTSLSDQERNLAIGPLDAPDAHDAEAIEDAHDDLGEKLEALVDEAAKSERSLAELQRYFEDQKSLLASTPSIWPARGWVTSDFGSRLDPYTAHRVVHKGLDIANRAGSAVIAPADGVVVYAGAESGYGKVVVLDHGFGVKTRFGHLSKIEAIVGQKVRRGQQIAAMGNTGRSTGPHLHYEVRVNGIPENPRKFILE
ncbi:Membrane protein related to metalloendopeptidase [Vulgatibacter incomptus]|uniref:Membrane protein related to metalloendopeptidase n=1 Tax=Vulgatibacter incomptus TaxID=1391653 RepID=A0A0K1PAY8_9BACT|nr:Membrane protein related to metalloendopeptidase [Vulgatibacter incomptus]